MEWRRGVLGAPAGDKEGAEGGPSAAALRLKQGAGARAAGVHIYTAAAPPRVGGASVVLRVRCWGRAPSWRGPDERGPAPAACVHVRAGRRRNHFPSFVVVVVVG